MTTMMPAAARLMLLMMMLGQALRRCLTTMLVRPILRMLHSYY
jgi:hypothetical protein